MFKLIVKCRKANVTHMLLPSVFVAVHEEKRKEAAQHKHKEREGLEYNRRAVFENRRESLHICSKPTPFGFSTKLKCGHGLLVVGRDSKITPQMWRSD